MSFADEILRVHQRYAVEVVEAFNICPFAKPARLADGVARKVILEPDPIAQSVALVRQLGDLARVQVGLLIYPLLKLDADEFDVFTNRVRAQVREHYGADGPFAMAPFHPQARWSADSPAKLVMFFRRTPDPTIQLVRYSALEEVRGKAPGGKFLFDWKVGSLAALEAREKIPLSQQIAENNYASVTDGGLGKIEAIYADICADRARLTPDR